MQRTRPQLRPAIVVAGTALFLIAVSWLPYHVAMKPSVSYSYLFGYNNRAAELLIGVCAVLLALFGPPRKMRSVAGKPLQASTLRKALACVVGTGGVLYLLTRRLEGFGESVYLIDRVKLAVEGKVPYKAFEYAYGPLFLYGPAWMTHWLHLPVGDAYGLFWLLAELFGVYLLYKTILWVDEPPGRQRTIFLFLLAATTLHMLTTGVNYTMLRFALPCYLALAIHRRLTRVEGPGAEAVTLLLAVPFLALVLLDSPEQGIAFGAGTAAYLAWFGRLRNGLNWLWFLFMLAGMAGTFWMAFRLGLFVTLNAFSTGGLNFPITPAPNLLLLYVCIGLVACYAGAQLRAGRSSALLMLSAISAIDLAAALGRCDPGHTLLNPLGITLAGCFLASGMGRIWRYFLPAVWAVYILLPLASGALATAAQLGKAALPAFLAGEPAQVLTPADRWIMHRMARSLGTEVAAQKFASIKAFAHMDAASNILGVYGQPPATVFAAPFDFAPSHFGIYHSRLVDEGYFSGDLNMVTQEQAAQKIAELSSHPERPLLMLPGREEECHMSAADARQRMLRLFYYPYRAAVVHPESVEQPLCDYITHHYRLAEPASAEHFGYALWLSK